MVDIPLVLDRIRPNAAWKIRGDRSDIANLEWQDKQQTEPTQAEVDAEWLKIQQEKTETQTEKTSVDTILAQIETVAAGMNVTTNVNDSLTFLQEDDPPVTNLGEARTEIIRQRGQLKRYGRLIFLMYAVINEMSNEKLVNTVVKIKRAGS